MPVRFDRLKDADGNTIRPATLEQAVDFLYDSLNDDEKDFVRENGCAALHFGLGMAMRNEWNLWETQGPEPIVRDVVARFRVSPGDDVSGKILDTLAERVGHQRVGGRVVMQQARKPVGATPSLGSNPARRASLLDRIKGWFR